MKEHPILFSAPMVRAIIEGRKTQTRRVVKPQPNPVDPRYAGVVAAAFRQGDFAWENKGGSKTISCKPNGPTGWAEENSPYGKPGDRLWVRETWGVGSRPDPCGGYDGIEYRADVAWLEEGDDLPCHKVTTPDDICLGDYRSGWKRPSTCRAGPAASCSKSPASASSA